MAMQNPLHSGRSIRQNCLALLDLNVPKAAQVLGVACHILSRILNGYTDISRRWRFGWKRRVGPMPSSGCADELRHAGTKLGSRLSDTDHSLLLDAMPLK